MKIGSIDLGERPVFLAPMEDVTDISFRLYGICIERRLDTQRKQDTGKTDRCRR